MAKLGSKSTKVEKKVEVTYPYKTEKTEGMLGRGSVTVTGLPMFINDCLLYDGSAEGAEKEYDPFVKYPQEPYTDKDGKTKWAKVAGLVTDEARKEVLDVVIHCFEKLMNHEDVGKEYTENGITLQFPRLNPISGKDNILMGFSVSVESLPVYINRLPVRTRDDGSHWTAYPRRPYNNKDGEKEWAPIAGPGNAEANKVITEALIEAINSK